MRLIIFILILCIFFCNGEEVLLTNSDLDVSSLPKRFREWHVRVVGDGYLRFLVPTSMDIFSSSVTSDTTADDEGAIYIANALHKENLDDQYIYKKYVLKTPASCVTSDNVTVHVTPYQNVSNDCVDTYSSCITDVGQTNQTVNIFETDPSTCASEMGSCMEQTGESRWAAILATAIPNPNWDVTTHIEGECISTRTITLDSAITGMLEGDLLSQDFGAVDGNIEGVIHKVETGGENYIIKDIVGFAGTSGVIPQDFKKGSEGGPDVRFKKSDGTISYTTHSIMSKVNKIRTFTPAIMKTFQPYISRNFTAATLGDSAFTQVYSRYGLLHVNKYRMLVNINGLLVLGKTKNNNVGFIHVPDFYASVSIRQNGIIRVTYNDESTEYIGQLTLSVFPNKYGLNFWGSSGFEIRCDGSGGFGTSLGSWCKNTNLNGKKMWYYAETIDSGHAITRYAAPFTATRLQQYHLNADVKDLYLSGHEPRENW